MSRARRIHEAARRVFASRPPLRLLLSIRRGHERLLSLCALLSLLAAPRPARADPTTLKPVPPKIGKPLSTRPENGYWSVGDPRWFLATKSDLGFFYVRPHLAFGYGLPHWFWAGVDLSAMSTIEFAGVYGGVRASSPLVDLAFGVRESFAYLRPFLAPRASYDYDDVAGAPGNKARYWAWEAEAVGVVPLPYSAILIDYVAIKALDAPADQYLYDESYRAIVANPFFQVLRFAAVGRFLHEGSLKVGVLTEYLFSTGREQSVVRVGPVTALQLTDHLEALATFTVAALSPDSLGLALGSYGLAGFRYRWATGEKEPKFPWQGSFVPGGK
jgi:hypothetical protein